MAFISFVTVCLFYAFFLERVNSQLQPIVNVPTISDGGTFNITCDANRVTIPPEDSAFTDILFLKIDVDGADAPSRTVAVYFPTNPQKEIKDPAGRNWAIEFSGGNGTSNRNTMRIEILVRDGKCTDAGNFTCTMNYFKVNNAIEPVSRTQNVTAEAAVKEPVLTLVPLNNGNEGQNYSIYQLNETVTMTCRVDGPENLVIKWRREIRPAAGIQVPYEDYPYRNDIFTTSPTQVVGSAACQQYRHTSTLEFAVSQLDKKRIYLCAVQVNNVDVVTAGATIDLEEEEVSNQLQPIVNVPTISDGGIFNITCDANRVTFPPEDSAFTDIFYLKIGVDSAEVPSKTVAQYFPSDPQSDIKDPAGRNWAIEFSGKAGTNNRNTMRIEILVRDAKCTDAGKYTCTVMYFTQTNVLKLTSKTQNMTAEGATIPVQLSTAEGDEPNIGLIVGVVVGCGVGIIVAVIIGVVCYHRQSKRSNNKDDADRPDGGTDRHEPYAVSPNDRRQQQYGGDNAGRDKKGPENLVIKWRCEVRPASGVQVPYEDYPYQNYISTIKDEI